MAGTKSPVSRLRDYLRLLTKRDTMKPQMVADLEAKVAELKEIIKGSRGGNKATTTLKTAPKSNKAKGRAAARPLSPEDQLRLKVLDKGRAFLAAGAKDPEERIALMVLQNELNSMIKARYEKLKETLKTERQERRTAAKALVNSQP